MTDDQQQHHDEIARLLAEDPNAHIVDGEQEAWLLTGRAVEVARAAVGRSRDGAKHMQSELDSARPTADAD